MPTSYSYHWVTCFQGQHLLGFHGYVLSLENIYPQIIQSTSYLVQFCCTEKKLIIIILITYNLVMLEIVHTVFRTFDNPQNYISLKIYCSVLLTYN